MRPRIFRKDHLFFISAILMGGAIEWYELYLFIHWGDIFSKLFFQDVAIVTTYNILFVFFVGVLGRPVGAILFGNIGDKFGRKIAFTLSLALVVLPSFLIAGIGWILPSQGMSVAITLCILRFIQGMAVGAELPGAMCYLAECSTKKERAFTCSFAFVGPHIGILLSQVESFFLEKYFSAHFIETYGWRISFIFGGMLALFAVLYRNRLEESPEYILLKNKQILSKNPLLESLTQHWRKLLNCFFTFLVSVVVFFMYTIFVEIYSHLFFETNKANMLLLGMVITLSEIVTLPLWGMVGDRFSLRKLLIGSTIAILCASLLLGFFEATAFLMLLAFIILISLNIQSALMPTYIAVLFPTAIRYSGIAISVSICDSLIGGGVPWLGGLLSQKIGIKETFVLLTGSASLISLFAFLISNRKMQSS